MCVSVEVVVDERRSFRFIIRGELALHIVRNVHFAEVKNVLTFAVID